MTENGGDWVGVDGRAIVPQSYPSISRSRSELKVHDGDTNRKRSPGHLTADSEWPRNCESSHLHVRLGLLHKS